jgi:hypothetical protein
MGREDPIEIDPTVIPVLRNWDPEKKINSFWNEYQLYSLSKIQFRLLYTTLFISAAFDKDKEADGDEKVSDPCQGAFTWRSCSRTLSAE